MEIKGINMEKMFKFELSEKEANTVLGALAELPFKVVNELIQKILATAQSQQAEKIVAEPV